MRERLLITGGTGFLGAALVEASRQAGWHPVVASRRPPLVTVEHRRYSLEAPPSPSLFEGVSHVIHAAAELGPSRHAGEDVNVAAARALLSAARLAGVQRAIFVSSFSADREGSRYARQKSACEELFLESGQSVVRLGLVLGGGGVVGAMARHLRRWRVVPLVSDGRQPLQTVHVGDASTALLRAVEVARADCFTVAEPSPTTYRGLIEALGRALGVRPRFVSIPGGALLRATRLLERLGWPAPVSSDSVMGLLRLAPRDTRSSLERLGLEVRSCAQSLEALAAAGVWSPR